jgi:hypothetical protein
MDALTLARIWSPLPLIRLHRSIHSKRAAHRQGCWWTPSSATSFHAAPAVSFNQGCVLVHDLESMLLRDPPQNRFSTVSVKLRHSELLVQCPLYLPKAVEVLCSNYTPLMAFLNASTNLEKLAVVLLLRNSLVLQPGANNESR